MKQMLLAMVFVGLGVALLLEIQSNYGPAPEPVVSQEQLSGANVVMYSLTTCGYCKAKAREFNRMNIPFSEYYIDKDNNYMDELNGKLQAAGFRPGGYGTPIIEVNGVMMPGNPAMSKIIKALENG